MTFDICEFVKIEIERVLGSNIKKNRVRWVKDRHLTMWNLWTKLDPYIPSGPNYVCEVPPDSFPMMLAHIIGNIPASDLVVMAFEGIRKRPNAYKRSNPYDS